MKNYNLLKSKTDIVSLFLHFDFLPDERAKDKRNVTFFSKTKIQKTGSIKVNVKKQYFKDFADDKFKGDIFCLIQNELNINIYEAYDWLCDYQNFDGKRYEQYPNSIQNINPKQAYVNPTLSIIRENEISSPIIVNYLEKRKIPLAIAKLYAKEYEIKSNRHNSPFIGIGMKTIMNSVELRIPKSDLKLSVGPKDITVFNVGAPRYILFEGIFSALSALRLFDKEDGRFNIIILNSVSCIYKAIEFLNDKTELEIFSAFDNDEAGRKATLLLKAHIFSAEDISDYFSPFNDFNDYLINHIKKSNNETKL